MTEEMVAMPVVYECAGCGEKWSREAIDDHIAYERKCGKHYTGFRFEKNSRGAMLLCPDCDPTTERGSKTREGRPNFYRCRACKKGAYYTENAIRNRQCPHCNRVSTPKVR